MDACSEYSRWGTRGAGGDKSRERRAAGSILLLAAGGRSPHLPRLREGEGIMESIPGTCPECGGVVSLRRPLEEPLGQRVGARVWSCAHHCRTFEPEQPSPAS